MSSFEGLNEVKGDLLLGLDEGWKNWLCPEKDTQSADGAEAALQDRLVKNGEVLKVGGSNGVKDESKETKEEIVVALGAEDIDGICSTIKDNYQEADSPNEECHNETNHLKEETDKTPFAIKDAQFESIFIKAYSSAIVKEEPVDDTTTIFQQTFLDFEKHKFHQEIFNEVMENLCFNRVEELQHEYINRLHKVANIEIFKCSNCDYRTMNKSNLKSHLFLIHRSELKIKMYKCLSCMYKTKSLTNIKQHKCGSFSDSYNSDIEAPYSPDSAPLINLVKKSKSFKKKRSKKSRNCDLCTFEAKDRTSLEQHYLSHKDPEDFKTFLCYVCHYESKSKMNLKKHLLKTHRIKTEGIDKIKKLKCDSCPFRTDQKKSLEAHSLIHKDPEEIELFSCEICEFKTKNKAYLKTHSLVHKNPDEIEKKYMCEICSKKFRVRSKLQFHLLTHKTNDEVELFSCSECQYKTKLKYNLRIHMEIHKEPSFVCDTCGLQSRRKWNHEMHLLTHKNDDEVQIFKCAVCSYQTKFKDRLKRHLAKGTHFGNKKPIVKRQRRNKLISEPNQPVVKLKKKFICDICGIKCSQKSALNTHSLKHKSPEEVKMHRCQHCGYETRIKGNLTTHLKIHKDPSEVTTFKCDTCGLLSRNKWNHKMHLLTHKSSTECELYSCNICSYQTKFKAYLREHLKKRHNINTAQRPGRPQINTD